MNLLKKVLLGIAVSAGLLFLASQVGAVTISPVQWNQSDINTVTPLRTGNGVLIAGTSTLATSTASVFNNTVIVDGIKYPQSLAGIQSAINVCSTMPFCNTVQLPPMAVTVADSINAKTGVNIECSGTASTTLTTTMAGDSIHKGIINVNDQDNITISNCAFVVGGSASAITSYGSTRLRISGIYATGNTTAFGGIINFDGDQGSDDFIDNTIENSYFQNIPNVRSVHLYPRNNNEMRGTKILHNVFSSTTVGISFDSFATTSGTLIDGNSFFDPIHVNVDSPGVAILGGISAPDHIFDTVVSNNYYLNTRTSVGHEQGFAYFYSTYNTVFSGNTLRGSYTLATPTVGAAFAPGRVTTPTHQLVIANNTIEGFDAAWDPDSMIDVDVHDNMVTNSGHCFNIGYNTQIDVHVHDNVCRNTVMGAPYMTAVLFANSTPVDSSLENNWYYDTTASSSMMNAIFLTGGFDFTGVSVKGNHFVAPNATTTTFLKYETGPEKPPTISGPNEIHSRVGIDYDPTFSNGNILFLAASSTPAGTSTSKVRTGDLNFTWDNFAKRLGVGTSSPFAKLSIHQPYTATGTTLFAISSSTVAATTTLFSVSNTGSIFTQLANGCVQAASGILTSTGVACGSGGGGSSVGWVYTLATDNMTPATSTTGITVNGTTTLSATTTVLGKLSVGLAGIGNQLGVKGADDSLPVLGTNSGKLGLFNGNTTNPLYGMLFNVLGTGNGTIQEQRVDASGTAYDLLLQPSGGNVAIGKTSSPTSGYKLEVSGALLVTGTSTLASTTAPVINTTIYVNGENDGFTGVAIQKAIDGCYAKTRFCEIVLSKGTWRVATTAIYYYGTSNVSNGQNIKIRGAGIDNTILKLDGDTLVEGTMNTIFQGRACDSNAPSCFAPALPDGQASSSMEISDMTLDMNGPAQTTFFGVSAAISLNNTGLTSYAHNLKIINSISVAFNRGAQQYGIGIVTSAHHTRMEDNIFLNNDEGIWLSDYYAGFGTDADTYQMVLNNFISSSTDANIYWEYGARNTITGNTISSSTNGIYGQVLDYPDKQNTIISHNIISSTTGYGIITKGANVNISNNSLSRIGAWGIPISGDNNIIEGNTLYDIGWRNVSTNEDGIIVDGGDGNVIIGNTLKKIGRQGIFLVNASSTSMTGNTIEDAGQSVNNQFACIALESGTYSNISGNTCVASSTTNKIGYGLIYNVNSHNNSAVNNNYQGFVTAAVNNAGNNNVFTSRLGSLFGFGTSTPSFQLSVAGTGYFSDTMRTAIADITDKVNIYSDTDQNSIKIVNSAGNGAFDWNQGQVGNDGTQAQNAMVFYTNYGGSKGTGENLDRFIVTPQGLGILPTGGIMAFGSSTLGAGAQITGLTISGGATTTGTSTIQRGLLVSGLTGLGVAVPTKKLDVSGNAKLSFTTQSGLQIENTNGLGTFDWMFGELPTSVGATTSGLAFFTDFGGPVGTGSNLNRMILASGGGLYLPTGGLFASSSSSLTGTTTSTNGMDISAGCYAVAGTCIVGANFGASWNITNGALAPTTTLGIQVSASSTIGAGTQIGGLTISGGATTTATSTVQKGLLVLDGLFGVGTGAPSSVLDVRKATASGRTNIDFTNTAASNAGDRLRLRLGAFTGFVGSDLHPYIESLIENTGTGATGLALGTYTGSGTTPERIRITGATGQVGIGTTTPVGMLHVDAGASATTTVTVGEIGLTSSKSCVNMNRSDGSAASYFINAAGTMVVEPNYCR